MSVWTYWKQHHPSKLGTPPMPAVAVAVESDQPALSPEGIPVIEELGDADDAIQSDVRASKLRWQRLYGDYRVQVTASGEFQERLRIFHHGIPVFESENFAFQDPERIEEVSKAPYVPAPMTDLTGEGQPCLVVLSHSGGAHCCRNYDVFQLGGEFKHLATLEAQHGTATFKDVDGDGIPEVMLRDWSHAYEFTCFAGSPAPEMALRYKDGRYVNAPELLFTDPPTGVEFAKLVREVQESYARDTNADLHVLSPSESGDAELWRAMLDLTYRGHLSLAMRLFEDCWRSDWPDKEKSLDHFWDVVSRSAYGRAAANAQGYDLPEPERPNFTFCGGCTAPCVRPEPGDPPQVALLPPEGPPC